MRFSLGFCASIFTIVQIGASSAHPDAPPWDHDGAEGAQDCTACHFDGASIQDSDGLVLKGLPKKIDPGVVYDLVVKLHSESLKNAGFLMTVHSANGGVFESKDSRTESEGTAIRSTYAGSRTDVPGKSKWMLQWRAPETLDAVIEFYIAANAGNDDQSPFGDEIHLKSYRIKDGK